MRLYSDTLTRADVLAAFRAARVTDQQDIYPVDVRMFRPRKYGRNGVEFYAEAVNGRYATGHLPIGTYPRWSAPRAASWSAYGYVIARLFALDPNATIGRYAGREDFASQVTQYTPRGESTDFLTVAGTCHKNGES